MSKRSHRLIPIELDLTKRSRIEILVRFVRSNSLGTSRWEIVGIGSSTLSQTPQVQEKAPKFSIL